MKIIIKDGVRYFPYCYENELEDLVKKYATEIFGKGNIFLEKNRSEVI